MMEEKKVEKSKRGFASMSREAVSEIARKGGRAAHAAGTAHEFTQDEAREAGRKGGKATHSKLREKKNAEINGSSVETGSSSRTGE